MTIENKIVNKLEYVVIYKLMCGHDKVVFRSSVDGIYNNTTETYCRNCLSIKNVNSIGISRSLILPELVNLFSCSYYLYSKLLLETSETSVSLH